MLICVGAANALANPKRLLRAVPGALYEVGVAVVVALSVAPQLVESVLRVRAGPAAARRRGSAASGRCGGIAIPVLEDALDRSLLLAAAMDSRGYGRTRAAAPRSPGGHRRAAARRAGRASASASTACSTAPRRALLGLPMLLAGRGRGGGRAGARRPAGAAQRLPARPLAAGRDRWSPPAGVAAAVGAVADRWRRPGQPLSRR